MIQDSSSTPDTGETRKNEEILKKELYELLKHFYWKIRKTNGEDFEPGSLRTIQRGLDRHLLRNEIGFSIVRDEVFKASKLKALKKAKETSPMQLKLLLMKL